MREIMTQLIRKFSRIVVRVLDRWKNSAAAGLGVPDSNNHCNHPIKSGWYVFRLDDSFCDLIPSAQETALASSVRRELQGRSGAAGRGWIPR